MSEGLWHMESWWIFNLSLDLFQLFIYLFGKSKYIPFVVIQLFFLFLPSFIPCVVETGPHVYYWSLCKHNGQQNNDLQEVNLVQQDSVAGVDSNLVWP